MVDKVRITFSCDADLRDKLTKRADTEGIPRSQLIVELLETELGDSPNKSKEGINRFIFDIQARVAQLEGWKRQFTEINNNLNTLEGKKKIPEPKK